MPGLKYKTRSESFAGPEIHIARIQAIESRESVLAVLSCALTRGLASVGPLLLPSRPLPRSRFLSPHTGRGHIACNRLSVGRLAFFRLGSVAGPDKYIGL